jgi:hypothetical protein
MMNITDTLKLAREALTTTESDCGSRAWEREQEAITTGSCKGAANGVAVLRACLMAVMDGNTSDGYHTFNELYDFRKAYNAALFNEWAAGGKCSVHKSWRHHDGELCFGGGWFIVVAVLPAGQISNHYEAKDWNLFSVPETERALFEFDGHSGSDVVARLESYTTPPNVATPLAAQPVVPLTDEQAEFESVFKLPSNCTKFQGGYAPTSHNAWEAQTFCARWEGWKARSAHGITKGQP